MQPFPCALKSKKIEENRIIYYRHYFLMDLLRGLFAFKRLVAGKHYPKSFVKKYGEMTELKLFPPFLPLRRKILLFQGRFCTVLFVIWRLDLYTISNLIRKISKCLVF